VSVRGQSGRGASVEAKRTKKFAKGLSGGTVGNGRGLGGGDGVAAFPLAPEPKGSSP
jgi:hypothetical protein